MRCPGRVSRPDCRLPGYIMNSQPIPGARAADSHRRSLSRRRPTLIQTVGARHCRLQPNPWTFHRSETAFRFSLNGAAPDATVRQGWPYGFNHSFQYTFGYGQDQLKLRNQARWAIFLTGAWLCRARAGEPQKACPRQPLTSPAHSREAPSKCRARPPDPIPGRDCRLCRFSWC
jgi:hypothetical protein